MALIKPLKLLAAFGLPALVIFGWMIFGQSSLGNDFQQYHVNEALNLRFFNALGIEPMWAMHLTGGLPYSGLAMAQYFHFPAWLISHLPGYTTGHALTLFALKGVLLLIFGHAVSYFCLRKLMLARPLFCYVLSFVSIYQLRMLDAFRFGNALDAVVYSQCLILLMLVYLGLSLQVTPMKKKLMLWVSITGLTQLLLTSGYPPMFPFAALAGLLSIFIFTYPPTKPLPDLGPKLLWLSLSILIGVLLAAPNWLPMTEWLAVNERRMLHSDLAWASFCPLGPVSLVSNFFRPWGAEIHTGFAGSTFLGLLLGALAISAMKNLKQHWPILVALALPFAYAVGAKSPVFVFFFKHVPLFSSIRVPGRIFAILPIFFLLAARELLKKPSEMRGAFRISAWINLGLLFISLLYLARFPGTGWFGIDRGVISPESLSAFWTPQMKALWILLGMGSCYFFASVENCGSKKAWVAVLALTLLQTTLMLQNGTWIQPKRQTLTLEQFKGSNHLPHYAKAELMATNELAESTWGSATSSYSQFIKAVGPGAQCYYPMDPGAPPRFPEMLLPFYMSDTIKCAKSNEEILHALSAEICDPSFRPHTWLSDPNCVSATTLTPKVPLAALNQANRLKLLSPNLMEIETSTPVASVLVTTFPNADANWRATVDEKPMPVVQLNGGFVGVRVPAGAHRTRISYFSKRVVMGYQIFFLGLALFAVFVVWVAFARSPGRLIFSLFFIVLWTSLCSALCLTNESALTANAERKLLLRNNYAELLVSQLELWRASLKNLD